MFLKNWRTSDNESRGSASCAVSRRGRKSGGCENKSVRGSWKVKCSANECAMVVDLSERRLGGRVCLCLQEPEESPLSCWYNRARAIVGPHCVVMVTQKIGAKAVVGTGVAHEHGIQAVKARGRYVLSIVISVKIFEEGRVLSYHLSGARVLWRVSRAQDRRIYFCFDLGLELHFGHSGVVTGKIKLGRGHIK